MIQKLLLKFVLKKLLFFSLIAIFIVIFLQTSFAQQQNDYRSIASGNWSTVAIWQKYDTATHNWSAPPGIPTGSVNVITISNGTTVSLDVNLSVDQLVVAGILTLDAGQSLNLFNGAGNDLTVTGNISGAGDINIPSGASADFQNGTISGAGTININAGGSAINSSSTVTFNRNISNSGTFNWASGSISGTGTITNNSVFNCQTNFGTSVNVPFVNNGTLNKTTNNQNIFFSSFTNSGTINVQSGNITLASGAGSVTVGGTISVQSGGTVQFGNSSFSTFTVNAGISGAGTVNSSTTAVNFSTSCIYNISGTTSAGSGTMTFTVGMTLTNIGNLSPQGGTIVLPSGLVVGAYGSRVTVGLGGALNLNTGTNFSFQKVTMNGGTFSGTDSISISDSLTVSTATFTGTGAITLKPGSYMTIFNNTPTIDKSIINNGTINWTLSSIFGAGTLYNNSVFNINNNALSCFLTTINAGTINKNSNTASQYAGSFTNLGTGVININAGSLMFSTGNGTYSIAGTVNVASGTFFQLGNSTFITFNVSGVISGAGNFYTHTTAVNFLPGSTYNIAGTTSSTSGILTFNAGMTLTNIGTIASSGGTLNLQSGLVVSAIGPTLNITGGGIINFNSGQKFQFTSISTNGTIAGSDTIVLNGNMAAGGTLSGTGPFNALSGSVIDINSNFTNNKTLNNAGTINWVQTGISGSGTINNNNVFNVSPVLNYTCTNLINNSTTINKNASGSPVFTGGINNSGAINITSGTLVLFASSGTFTNSGTYSVSASCGVSFGQASGTTSYVINGTISGAGAVTFTAPTVTFGAASIYNISGTTTASSGTVNFNSTMTITNLGNLTVSGATVNFPAGTTIGSVGTNLILSSGAINFNTGISKTFTQIDLSGTLGGTDTVFINTTLNWTGGGISNTAVLKTGGTCAVNSSTVTLSGKFINNGTFTWSQLQVSGNGTFINNSILNFIPGAIYTFSPNLINNGTLNKNTTTFIPTIAGLFTNNGTVNINSGGIAVLTSTNYSPAVINIASGTTFAVNNGTFTTTGTMNIAAGSTINGNGIINYNAPVLVNDGSISVTTFQFDSITTLSGIGSINMVNCNFLTGCNVSLASNHQFKNITLSAGSAFNLNGYKAYLNGTGTTIINNGAFNISNSTIEYNGTSQQTISTQNITYKNLNVNNSSGVNLTGTLNVDDTLSILSGFLNLNQNNILLSSTGYLRELNGTVRGVNGTISTTRTLDSLDAVNVAGLGATITTKKVLGLTTISRGHNPYTINGSTAVQRFYNISPTNNTFLNATLVYHYDNSELNGLNKNFLALYRSTNSGTNWTLHGGSKDTVNNTVTYTNINAFSYWIAANNPLAAYVNITAIIDAMYNTSTGTLNKRDTMTVYLRNISAPYSIIDSAKILPDTITFSANAYFNVTPSGTYYITVKSRNSLEVWSKSGGQSYTTGTSMSYDFTSAQSQSYGNSTILKNGKYCIISGDLNQDGFVNGNDFTQFSQQFGQSGYLRADLNGDNVVNGNDFTSFSASFGKQSNHP